MFVQLLRKNIRQRVEKFGNFVRMANIGVSFCSVFHLAPFSLKRLIFKPLSSEAYIPCGLASENLKFLMLALRYSIDQKFHADDENTPELQF
jgi:hypothetical protein